MNKILSLALEEAEQEVIDAPLEREQMQEEQQELVVQSTEIEEATQNLEDASAAVHALEELADAIELCQNPELSPAESSLVEVSLEHIYTSLGLSRPSSLSLEAEDSPSIADRVQRLKAEAMRLIQAILTAFQEAMQWMANYLRSATQAAARMEKYALATQRRLRDLKGVPKATTYESASMGKKLYSDDVSVLEAYKRVQLLTRQAINTAYSDHVKLLNEAIDGFVAERDIEPLIQKLPEVIRRVYGETFKENDDHGVVGKAHGAGDSDVDVKTTPTLLGGYVAYLVLPSSLDDLWALNFGIQRLEDLEFSEQVQAANVTEMENLVREVILTCSMIRQFEREQKRLDELKVRLTSAVSKLKSFEGDVSADDRQFFKAIARVAPKLAQGLHQKVFGFSLSASRAVLEHCDRSAALFVNKAS